MESTYSPVVLSNSVVFKSIAVDAINVAYREAGDPTHPKLVLLHGWPASSHQYRDLIPKLSKTHPRIRSNAPQPASSSTAATGYT
jgi:pimeloyl-ACP methyl ester carboxylesterase